MTRIAETGSCINRRNNQLPTGIEFSAISCGIPLYKKIHSPEVSIIQKQKNHTYELCRNAFVSFGFLH